MDLTGNQIYSYYLSIASQVSNLYIWLLLPCLVAYFYLDRRQTLWLVLLVFLNQLVNHLFAGYLFDYPMVWNIAWIISDAILAYCIFRKVKFFKQASFEDLSVLMLCLISALINLFRYIERLHEYYGYESLYSIKPVYGVGVNSVNLVTLIILSFPIAKILFLKLKDKIDAAISLTYRNSRRNANRVNY